MSVIDQAKLLIEQMDRGEKARLLAHLASDPDFGAAAVESASARKAVASATVLTGCLFIRELI